MLFKITTNQYIKLGDYSLLIKAKLLSYSLHINDELLYTTNQNLVTLSLSNTNCEFESGGIDSYLIFNKLTNYTFTFKDNENDKVLLNLTHDSTINSFIQSKTNLIFSVSLLSNSEVITETQIKLLYTDSFHPGESNIIKFNVTLLQSNPPMFKEDLSIININNWRDYLYQLPEAEDIDGDNFTISLGSLTPNWINLVNNSFILFKTSEIVKIPSNNFTVEIILTDENGSWDSYINKF